MYLDIRRGLRNFSLPTATMYMYMYNLERKGKRKRERERTVKSSDGDNGLAWHFDSLCIVRS